MFSLNKRGQMGQAVAGLTGLASVVILFVVIAMISAFGSDIVDDTKDDLLTGAAGCNATATTSCPTSYNNTVNGNEAIGNVTTKMPTLATVLIGAFIILILVAAFSGFLVMRQ